MKAIELFEQGVRASNLKTHINRLKKAEREEMEPRYDKLREELEKVEAKAWLDTKKLLNRAEKLGVSEEELGEADKKAKAILGIRSERVSPEQLEELDKKAKWIFNRYHVNRIYVNGELFSDAGTEGDSGINIDSIDDFKKAEIINIRGVQSLIIRSYNGGPSKMLRGTKDPYWDDEVYISKNWARSTDWV